MTFLPIVGRELRIAARLKSTYRNRTVAAGLVMLGAVATLSFGIFAKAGARAGANLFQLLSFITLLFCILEGVRKTADCLSEEKRAGTLGLLFLTDLKGYDVVLGKFAATSLSSIYGLFAILPVLALPMIVGGIPPTEFWRMVLALANILFFSLCAGMLVSAWSRRENFAMGGTVLLVSCFMLLPKVFGNKFLAVVSPAHAYVNSFATAYLLHFRAYWLSLVITQILSWLMLAVASVMLPEWWQERPEQPKRGSWLTEKAKAFGRSDAERARDLSEIMAVNPACWLAEREPGRSNFLWGLTAVTALSCLVVLLGPWKSATTVFFGIAWLINLTLMVMVASQACHILAEARNNNALEVLLVTPLTANEILEGQLLALKHIFRNPAVAIVFIELFTTLGTFGKDQHNQGAMEMDQIGTIFLILSIAWSFLNVFAATWAGMWFGLTSKNEGHALTKTVVLVLILPYACALLGFNGIPFFVGLPVFWIVGCSHKLRKEFRTRAAERFGPRHDGSEMLSSPPNPATPALISS